MPLGLYLHIPFCRKRCKFCYFRVYTDKNAQRRRDVRRGAVARDRAGQPAAGDGRPAVPLRLLRRRHAVVPVSAKQLTSLVDRLRANINWDQAEEVTFECEPGTLSRAEGRRRCKELGVTRLSLGVENFSDAMLEENGRAHLSGEVYKAWDWIQAAGFPNVNIDLIAGMVGETWDNWRENVQQDDRARARQRDDLPDGAAVQHGLLARTFWATRSRRRSPIGRRSGPGSSYAFDELLAAGYHVSSAYTLVKDPNKVNFSYRDNLWQRRATCWPPASPASATSRACTIRT